MTTTTRPIQRDVCCRFASLPPGLPESITAPHAEQAELQERQRAALARHDDLADERHDEAARRADAQLAAIAVRAGKPASSVGTPNADKLEDDRTAALSEDGAIIAAIGQIDAEIGAEFGKLINNPKTSGEAEAEAAIAKYRRAVEAVLVTREAAYQAISRAAFLRLAAPSETWPEANGMPVPLPSWLDVAVRRLHTGPVLRWQPAAPLVSVNTISRAGERDFNLRPVSAAHLVAQTFGTEINTDTKAD